MPATRRIIKSTMAALGVATMLPIFIFAGLVASPLKKETAVARTRQIAITNIDVVDIKSGSVLSDQSIVITDGKITVTGDSAVVKVPPEARLIDGRGHFVMPALWDMHTHVYAISPLLDMPLYVAYGVTNVRDLQGCPAKGDPFIACYEDKRKWTSEAMAGTRVGPRIFESSSFMANGPGMAKRLGNVPDYFDVANANQARKFVRHFVGKSDAIKVYDNIPREAYLALTDEASKVGLKVVGHKPRSVSAVEAARHQRSIEHARFLLHETYDGADELRKLAGTSDWKEDRRAMVDRHNIAAAQRIFDAMREYGTYYVPTHLTRWSDAYADSADVIEDPALMYMHPLMKMQWREDIDALLKRDSSLDARKAYMDFYIKGLALTKQAHDAGVKVMVGTDYITPGLDVHRELEQLVRAGLSPRDALEAATIVPAEYAGASELYGDIATGKIADLIILNANPLEDIRNTQSIEAVIFSGSVYDRENISFLKERVKSNARSWKVGAKIIWRFIRKPTSY